MRGCIINVHCVLETLISCLLTFLTSSSRASQLFCLLLMADFCENGEMLKSRKSRSLSIHFRREVLEIRVVVSPSPISEKLKTDGKERG